MKDVFYIIGDIHGCMNEYLKLEANIFKHAKKIDQNPIIISCGDLIDRGPQSFQVVEHFRKNASAGTHLAVLGNHEVIFLCILRELCQNFPLSMDLPDHIPTYKKEYDRLPKELREQEPFKDFVTKNFLSWLRQGGKETLESYGVNDFYNPKEWAIPLSHIEYLCSLPLLIEGPDFYVTHALAGQIEIHEYKEYLKSGESQNIHRSFSNLVWNRDLREVISCEKPVISGHTPRKGIHRLKNNGFIQVDTGCVLGRRLTAWCSYTNRILYTKSKTDFRKKAQEKIAA